MAVILRVLDHHNKFTRVYSYSSSHVLLVETTGCKGSHDAVLVSLFEATHVARQQEEGRT